MRGNHLQAQSRRERLAVTVPCLGEGIGARFREVGFATELSGYAAVSRPVFCLAGAERIGELTERGGVFLPCEEEGVGVAHGKIGVVMMT